MSSPEYIDQPEQGLGRMLSQWDGKSVIRGLFNSFLINVGYVEDMYFQLLNERDIYSAIGAQLDILGSIVGEDRLGRGDEEYRQAIFNRIALNSSDGTTTKVLEILKLTTAADNVKLFEYFPASVHYFTDGTVTNETPATMDSASAAGVSVRVMFDGDNQSFIGAGLVIGSSELGVNITDTMGVEPSGDTLGVESFISLSVEGKSYLPHDESSNTGTINPLCAVI